MAAATLFALTVWWGSTQALLWLVRLAPRGALNGAAAVLGVAGVAGVGLTATEASVLGVYGAFAAAILLWAAFEVAFLSGAILGVDARPADDKRVPRAWAAFRAIIWHELALALTVSLLAAYLVGAPNRAALYTFALLWAMRISAKLNLFLGVRNLCTEFLPAPVAHLSRHFRRRSLNALFPFSVLAGTLAAAFLARAALDPAASAPDATLAALLAALATLGTAEHWLMLTPISPLNLWAASPGRVTLARPFGVARRAYT